MMNEFRDGQLFAHTLLCTYKTPSSKEGSLSVKLYLLLESRIPRHCYPDLFFLLQPAARFWDPRESQGWEKQKPGFEDSYV